MSSIKVTAFNVYKELSTAPVNWLLANVGDKIRVETTFKVSTYCLSSSDVPIIINANTGYLGTGWTVGSNDVFKDFKIGDTIAFGNYVTNTLLQSFTILDKLSDNEIQVSAAYSGFGDNYETGQAFFSITKPITAIKYKWNFIENLEFENFNSKVTGTEQLLVIEEKLASDTAPSNMEFIGDLDYQQGSATIQGVSIDSATIYASTYKIIHYLTVTPFILYNQIADVELDINPADFFNLNCWKFIYQIGAYYEYSDPNAYVTEVFTSTLGNTGYYNENFNTGTTNYYVDSIVYTNPDAEVIDSIGLSTAETTVTITVKNTVDSPFSNNNTKFVLGIFKVPTDPAEYQANGKTMDANFLYDRALQTVGSASVDGDQWGVTSRQILKDVVGTYVSATTITITCKIAMLAAVIESFEESDTPKYLIFVSVQKHTLATADADLVTLKADIAEFSVITTDETMITIDNVFIRHPEYSRDTEGVTPGIAPAVDPADFVWGVEEVVHLNKNLNIVLDVLNVTIGAANWDTDVDTTIQSLVNSINTNTANGTILTASPFDNSIGITATWLSTGTYTGTLTLIFPPGIGDGLNGNTLVWVENGSQLDYDLSPPTYTINDGVPEGVATFDVFPEDEVVAASRFYIDRTGRTADDITLTSVEGKIKAKNSSTLEEFDLDGFVLQTEAYPFVGDSQYMNVQVARQFHVPLATIRKHITLKRRDDLDDATKRYYEMNYPFMIQWEYWAKLNGVNSDFFDTTEPQNGFNEFWHRYTTESNWGLYLELTVNADKNGDAQQYQLEQEITSHDYSSNAAFTTKTIKTYDPDTLTQLYDAGTSKHYILGYKNTLVKAVFTKAAPPVNATIVIRLEVFEQGGIYGSRRMSSKWESDSDTWFVSTINDYKTQVAIVSNTATGSVLIDFTKIPNNSRFKLTARIYEIGGSLLTDDGIVLTNDDGVTITID